MGCSSTWNTRWVIPTYYALANYKTDNCQERAKFFLMTIGLLS